MKKIITFIFMLCSLAVYSKEFFKIEKSSSISMSDYLQSKHPNIASTLEEKNNIMKNRIAFERFEVILLLEIKSWKQGMFGASYYTLNEKNKYSDFLNSNEFVDYNKPPLEIIADNIVQKLGRPNTDYETYIEFIKTKLKDINKFYSVMNDDYIIEKATESFVMVDESNKSTTIVFLMPTQPSYVLMLINKFWEHNNGTMAHNQYKDDFIKRNVSIQFAFFKLFTNFGGDIKDIYSEFLNEEEIKIENFIAMYINSKDLFMQNYEDYVNIFLDSNLKSDLARITGSYLPSSNVGNGYDKLFDEYDGQSFYSIYRENRVNHPKTQKILFDRLADIQKKQKMKYYILYDDRFLYEDMEDVEKEIYFSIFKEFFVNGLKKDEGRLYDFFTSSHFQRYKEGLKESMLDFFDGGKCIDSGLLHSKQVQEYIANYIFDELEKRPFSSYESGTDSILSRVPNTGKNRIFVDSIVSRFSDTELVNRILHEREQKSLKESEEEAIKKIEAKKQEKLRKEKFAIKKETEKKMKIEKDKKEKELLEMSKRQTEEEKNKGNLVLKDFFIGMKKEVAEAVLNQKYPDIKDGISLTFVDGFLTQLVFKNRAIEVLFGSEGLNFHDFSKLFTEGYNIPQLQPLTIETHSNLLGGVNTIIPYEYSSIKNGWKISLKDCTYTTKAGSGLGSGNYIEIQLNKIASKNEMKFGD